MLLQIEGKYGREYPQKIIDYFKDKSKRPSQNSLRGGTKELDRILKDPAYRIHT